MKILSVIVLLLLLSSPLGAISWSQGTVTKSAWHDLGGHQIEVDGIRYVFVQTARIKHDNGWHEVPDRVYLLTPKTRVRIQKEGFRIYALEIEGR